MCLNRCSLYDVMWFTFVAVQQSLPSM